MGMGAQLKRYKALNPGENHARAAAGGRGCTQAGVALHMHMPTHTYPCTCTCTCTFMHLHMHLHTSHGCSQRRFRRCSWPAARGNSWLTWWRVGPP